MENNSTQEGVLTPIKFHFYSLKFTPYNENKKGSSESILFDVITFLSNEMLQKKGYLVDRIENKTGPLASPTQITLSLKTLTAWGIDAGQDI